MQLAFGLVGVDMWGARKLLGWATRERTSDPFDVYFTACAPAVEDSRAEGGIANSGSRLAPGGSVWVKVAASETLSVEPQRLLAGCPVRASERGPGLWEVRWDETGER